MSDGVVAVRFNDGPMAKQLGRVPKAVRQSLRGRTNTRIGRGLGLDAHAVRVFVYLSPLGHRATDSWPKPSASGPLDEPRGVAHRVTYLPRLHASRELVEHLLGDLLAQAVELPRKSTSLRFRNACWEAKITTTGDTTACRTGVDLSVLRRRWLWFWINWWFGMVTPTPVSPGW